MAKWLLSKRGDRGCLILKPGKHQRSKQRYQDLAWKDHDPAQSFVLRSCTICMNYETNTLLLDSSSVRSKQVLCFVHGQGQKSQQKQTTKSFDEFHNHSPLLTMMAPSHWLGVFFFWPIYF